MERIIAIIYRVYVLKKVDIPYTRTCFTVVGLLFIHLVQLMLIFKIPSYFLFPLDFEHKALDRWLKASVVLTTLIILFLILFKENKLQRYEINEIEILKVKKVIPIYFFVTVIFLVILLTLKGIKQGTI